MTIKFLKCLIINSYNDWILIQIIYNSFDYLALIIYYLLRSSNTSNKVEEQLEQFDVWII